VNRTSNAVEKFDKIQRRATMKGDTSMLKLTNTKVVGGFVLGAIALLVAAIVLFGGGALFPRTTRALVYFQGGAVRRLVGIRGGAISG
jgi:hypothetical protein